MVLGSSGAENEGKGADQFSSQTRCKSSWFLVQFKKVKTSARQARNLIKIPRHPPIPSNIKTMINLPIIILNSCQAPATSTYLFPHPDLQPLRSQRPPHHSASLHGHPPGSVHLLALPAPRFAGGDPLAGERSCREHGRKGSGVMCVWHVILKVLGVK